MTRHRADAGWLHLSVVIDAFHRHVVGWAMDGMLSTDLVLSAFQMAQQVQRPALGLVHHSDQGSPIGSLRFGRHLRATDVIGSMGRSCTPAHNAVAERFFATLQTELLDHLHRPTRDTLRMAIFEFIEVFCNRQRRQSHLGYLNPEEYQRRWYEQQAQAQITNP